MASRKVLAHSPTMLNSGVYKLTNKKTDEFYIGSSADLGLRRRKHFYRLLDPTAGYVPDRLARSFESCKAEDIEFAVIELVDVRGMCCTTANVRLSRRVRFWVKRLNPPLNSKRILPAGCHVTVSFTVPKAFRRRISEVARERGYVSVDSFVRDVISAAMSQSTST